MRFIGLWICLLGGGAAVCSGNERPHLLVLLSDDLGRLETSVYGSAEVRTPTLKRLADQGVTFDNAYVASPSCCPNRYSLLTGLMPARHGAHPNHSLPHPGTNYLLPVLQRMGYRVAAFGKVQHGRREMVGADFLSSSPRNLLRNVRRYFETHDVQQPLCLLVGDRRPHVAWTKEQDYDPKQVALPSTFIDTPETREHWARYLTDISRMDAELGQVYDLVEERLGDDLLCLFTSDHGGQWPRGKWNLYDSGTRVPLIVSWPDKLAAGQRSDALVSWVDLLPTVIDLVGGQVPDRLDGQSFAAVLKSPQAQHRKHLFTTHTGDGAMNIYPMRSVRRGQYKFIHNLCPDAYHTNHSDRLRKDGAGAYWDSWDIAARNDPQAAEKIRRYYTRDEFELFDLAADPLELENLAEDPRYIERLAELQAVLAKWTTAQGDELAPHRDPYPASEPLPELASGK